ncbi:DNA-binding transcriptional regulator, MarR family [Lentzea albidocapillata subsp. violacea]|uniref:DNA-binding transcriptional regulator, MarR family n=1 Tax=Lentzea albidocapillata subsp. violacea TaxID=128104 RepID=A0A1G8Z826_9PSEU|nr:MarR family transcriptional regulator [Lentzea albidocapillata]SDK10774.1 DNA-binding transcriptional regulator, MarR family [Lentzea albidocapillata subsp. violacea]
MNIGLLLFIPNRYVENRMLAAVVNAGFEVTQAQARVLMRVGPEGTRLTELAEAAQVTKQTAGFLVDQLEQAGYLERVPDPTDGRARLVRVTEKAKFAVPVANEEMARMEAEWEQHIGKRRMAQLREALEMLGEITDPYR